MFLPKLGEIGRQMGFPGSMDIFFCDVLSVHLLLQHNNYPCVYSMKQFKHL